MAIKLYELANSYNAILDTDNPDFATALEQIESAFEEKAESVAKVIRMLEAEAEAFAEEAKRMSEKAKSRANRVDGLKAYLLEQMQAIKKGQIKGKLLTVAVQASPPACRVTDLEAVPSQYRIPVPATFRVDTRAILEQHKATGDPISGVEVTRGSHIRIR